MAQTINVDITPGVAASTLHYSQGDVGREWHIKIISRDGTTIPNGSAVKIEATKPSGLGFSVSGSLSGDVATFVTTETMTNEAGCFMAELKVSYSSVVIASANFYLSGEKSPHPDETIDGDAETLLPQMTLLVERVEAAAESIHDLSVEATTLTPGSPATAVYDEENNEITFGIPRGSQLTATDDGNGNITLTFS